MDFGRIKALSPEVIGQIAAGEVVERPASAIKELVENSLDAQATAITVDIRDGGLTSFRVTDNGKGINPEDIRLAFARHATSKIREAQDLYGVESLGFRGEALASIAAVAKVTCVTRTKDSDVGMQAVNEGGSFTDIRDAACPEGTSFTVKDLFFNAPVRRKFMKKPSTEAAAVSDLMERLILSRPDVSFRFISDGKSIYFSSGDGKLENACMSIFGLSALKMMVPVHGTEGGVVIDGLVGIGEASRGNRSKEYFFINNRAMKSTILSSALEEACRQLVTIGRFPICALHLTVPYESVDVNVHPNKWEVRFSNEMMMRQSVVNIISDALIEDRHQAPRIPSVFVTEDKRPPAHVNMQPTTASPLYSSSAFTPANQKENAAASASDMPAAPLEHKVFRTMPQEHSSFNTLHESTQPMMPRPIVLPTPRQNTPAADIPVKGNETAVNLSLHQEVPAEIPAEEEKTEEKVSSAPSVQAEQTEQELIGFEFKRKPLRMIGIAFDTYIIMQYEDRLLMADQHAIHERLLYEKLMREMADSSASQTFLLPHVIKLSHPEYNTFLANQEALHTAGFDADDFGDLTVQLRGVPIVLGQPQADRCFIDALEDLMTSGGITEQEKVQRIIQMSCKHAVKGGEKLPDEALIELVYRMLTEDIRYTCPHGRPLMIELTQTDLEKRFKRIQS